jgi:hypothetical protein
VNLFEGIMRKIFEAEYVQNVDGAAGALGEKPAVDACNQPLKHP